MELLLCLSDKSAMSATAENGPIWHEYMIEDYATDQQQFYFFA